MCRHWTVVGDQIINHCGICTTQVSCSTRARLGCRDEVVFLRKVDHSHIACCSSGRLCYRLSVWLLSCWRSFFSGRHRAVGELELNPGVGTGHKGLIIVRSSMATQFLLVLGLDRVPCLQQGHIICDLACSRVKRPFLFVRAVHILQCFVSWSFITKERDAPEAAPLGLACSDGS